MRDGLAYKSSYGSSTTDTKREGEVPSEQSSDERDTAISSPDNIRQTRCAQMVILIIDIFHANDRFCLFCINISMHEPSFSNSNLTNSTIPQLHLY